MRMQQILPVACGVLACVISCRLSAAAQGTEPSLVRVTTDRDFPNLPRTFGVIRGNFASAVNRRGDYLFAPSPPSTAMFLQRAGEAAATRLLQVGDEVPGFPDSRANAMFSPQINDAGLAAFVVNFSLPSGQSESAVIGYDDHEFRTIASSRDLAPGSGGARYEVIQFVDGIDDSGEVVFRASLAPPSLPARTALFMTTEEDAVRIAGIGDAAPGTAGTFQSFAPIKLNGRGELLFWGNLAGGAGGSGLFVGSVAGVRKVVADGDPNPRGGTFSFPFVNGVLNESGCVAFVYNRNPFDAALFLHDPVTGLRVIAKSGDRAPQELGSSLSFIYSADAISDDEIIFSAAALRTGLLRYRADTELKVVAASGQPVGQSGFFTGAFRNVSMNQSGEVAFLADVSRFDQTGVFRQSGSDLPEMLALTGEPAPIPGGGRYFIDFFSQAPRVLEDGSVIFSSDLVGSVAFAGVFVAGAGDTRVLVHTATPLPSGARLSLRSKVVAAGDWIGFVAGPAGGLSSLMVYNPKTGQTFRAVTEGDPLPGTFGARASNLFEVGTAYVNNSGAVAFSVLARGGYPSTGNGVFLFRPGFGVTKIVWQRDPGPDGLFQGTTLRSPGPPPINSRGDVLFRGLAGSGQALYVGSADGPPRKIVTMGDPAPGGGRFLSLATSTGTINELGEVAFTATVQNGASQSQGIFLGTPGGPVAKIVQHGDRGPLGSAFLDLPQAASVNDAGQVAFIATLNGGPGGGLFVGSPNQMPCPVALNGDATPAGGRYAFTAPLLDAVLNNSGDLVFRAGMVGGSSDSGLFVVRHDGTTEVVAVQGQAAPGMDGMFGTFPSNFLTSQNFPLNPDGTLAFTGDIISGDLTLTGHWLYDTNGNLEKIIVRGEALTDGSGVLGFSLLGTVPLAGGEFALWAGPIAGDFTNAIYIIVKDTPDNQQKIAKKKSN